MSIRILIAAACCAALVLVPAGVAGATSPGAGPPGATLTTEPAAPAPSSSVTLRTAPARPLVGGPVRLVLIGAPPGASGFAWDLTGRGVYAHNTGPSPQIETRFASPGAHSIAVRFTASGHTRRAVLTVDVAAAPAPRRPHRTATARAAPARKAGGLTGRVTAAHTAGDPGVTVADFHFSPSSTTIHVGDTITWTNNGPSSHTASARGGGFDTGVLKRGQSASHTFTQPGTFTYFCQIHPFMHGTIVVLAATTSAFYTTFTTFVTSTTPTATAATAPTATTAAAPQGPTLPNTGFDVGVSLFVGLLLTGAGVALRCIRAR